MSNNWSEKKDDHDQQSQRNVQNYAKLVTTACDLHKQILRGINVSASRKLD